MFDHAHYTLLNFKISDDYLLLQTISVTKQGADKFHPQIVVLKLKKNLSTGNLLTITPEFDFNSFILTDDYFYFLTYSSDSEKLGLNKINIDSLTTFNQKGFSFQTEKKVLLTTSRNFQLVKTGDKEFGIFGNNKILFLNEDGEIKPNSLFRLSNDIHQTTFLKDQFWMTDLKGGIQNFSRKKGKLTSSFFKKFQINRIFLDKEDNLWFSTKNSGMIIVPNLDKNLISNSNSTITSHVAQTISKNLGNQTLVGTKKGEIIFLEKGEIQNSMKLPNVTSIYSIVKNPINNNLVIGTNETILELTKDKKLIKDNSQKKQLSIKTIEFDKKNRLWAGNYTGCWLIEESKILTPNFISNGKKIVNSRTYATLSDFEENIWIGSTQGLYKYIDEEANPFLTNGIHEKYYFTSIAQSPFDSSIWAGTHGDGLLQIKNDKLISHYKEDNQLVSNICNDLFTDEKNLWIATTKGLQKLNLETNTFELFNKYDGFPTNDISTVAVNKNIVYVGTNKGIVTFRADIESRNIVPPQVHLTDFSIFDKDTTLLDQYDLEHNQNSIQIDFIGLAYKCRGEVQYKYRLIGLDTNWVKTDTRYARFPGLDNGNYEFQVVAMNEDNVESINPGVIKINISPPYWETWWFRTFAFLTGTFLIGGFFNFRYRTIKRREKLEVDFNNQLNDLRAQALQTQMNPHFIFNSMNAIQHFLTINDNENAMIYLARFAKLIRFIFDHSKEKTISLQKELDFLKVYVSLEKLRFQDKVSTTIDFDKNVGELKDQIYLPPLLIQPVVENAFKHGLFHKNGNGHLQIKFTYSEPILTCIVEDNGIGRKKSAEYNHWRKNSHVSSGLKSTIERIELLNIQNPLIKEKTKENSFLIIDLTNASGEAKGTKVEINLKNQTL